jgi:hypothetical protein
MNRRQSTVRVIPSRGSHTETQRRKGHIARSWMLPLLILCGVMVNAQDRPQWAKNLPNLPVKAGWYQGLGMAKAAGKQDTAWDAAASRARAQIASQIRVRINSSVTHAVQETASGTDMSLTDAYASTTEQITTATLEGIVLERWFDEDDGMLYAYGAISQAEVEARFREKMQDALASARIYYAAARKAMERDDPFTACGQLLEAMKVVSLAEASLERTISASMDGTGPAIPVFPVLQSKMCGFLSRLQFEALGGDQQEGQRGKALGEPLKGRIQFQSEHGLLPVRNAEVGAAFIAPATGKLPTDFRTNAAGEFTIPVNEISSGDAANRIRVTLALPGLAALAGRYPDLARCNNATFLDYAFSLKSRSTSTVAIRIIETNLGAPRAKSAVQEQIQRLLVGGRYTVIEESKVLRLVSETQLNQAITSGDYHAVAVALGKIAEIAVIGQVEATQRNNPVPQIYFSAGRAVVRVVDCKTGVVLGSVNLENEKEGGATYENAGSRLLEAMAKKVGDRVKTELDRALE